MLTRAISDINLAGSYEEAEASLRDVMTRKMAALRMLDAVIVQATKAVELAKARQKALETDRAAKFKELQRIKAEVTKIERERKKEAEKRPRCNSNLGDEMLEIVDRKTGTTEWLQWNSSAVLGTGCNKDVFEGTFKDMQVAVCVARTAGKGDHDRVQAEIKILERVQGHPSIIKLFYHGIVEDRLYLVEEMVRPVGYDLQRMADQYYSIGKQVPESLMIHALRQVHAGLSHMHSVGLLHRDMKTENVLITTEFSAKIIDMGLACENGTRSHYTCEYMAPEVITGKRTTVAVDFWGVGVIIHQVYQRSWQLIDTSEFDVQMRDGMPSVEQAMPRRLRAAMLGLLQFEVKNRWTFEKLEEYIELDDDDVAEQHCSTDSSFSCFTTRFETESPFCAFAAKIDARHKDILGTSIHDLHLHKRFGVIILFVEYPNGDIVTCPTRATTIEADMWIYFRVPSDDQQTIDRALDGIAGVLSGKTLAAGEGIRWSRAPDSPLKLLAFSLELDAFQFPAHVPPKSKLGPDLGLRTLFGVTLAGVKKAGHAKPHWLLGSDFRVSPGDLGLIARQPCCDGSTANSVPNAVLQNLMDSECFRRIIANSWSSKTKT